MTAEGGRAPRPGNLPVLTLRLARWACRGLRRFVLPGGTAQGRCGRAALRLSARGASAMSPQPVPSSPSRPCPCHWQWAPPQSDVWWPSGPPVAGVSAPDLSTRLPHPPPRALRKQTPSLRREGAPSGSPVMSRHDGGGSGGIGDPCPRAGWEQGAARWDCPACDHAGLALGAWPGGQRQLRSSRSGGGVPQRKPSPRGWVLEPLRMLPHVASAWDLDPDPGLAAG